MVVFRHQHSTSAAAVTVLAVVFFGWCCCLEACAPASQNKPNGTGVQNRPSGSAAHDPHLGTGIVLAHTLVYQANDTTRTGQLVYQDRNYPEGSFCVLILLHDEFGVDDWLYARALEFAEMGYVVVCPNLSGLGGHDARDKQVTENVEAALAACDEVIPGCGTTADRAVLGWDIGGTYALTCARTMRLKGAVICYGQLLTNEEGLLGVREPLLGVYGMDDPIATMDGLEQFRLTMDRMGGQFDAFVYRNEGRLFLRHPRDPGKARDAEFEITSWLHRYCPPNPG